MSLFAQISDPVFPTRFLWIASRDTGRFSWKRNPVSVKSSTGFTPNENRWINPERKWWLPFVHWSVSETLPFPHSRTRRHCEQCDRFKCVFKNQSERCISSHSSGCISNACNYHQYINMTSLVPDFVLWPQESTLDVSIPGAILLK